MKLRFTTLLALFLMFIISCKRKSEKQQGSSTMADYAFMIDSLIATTQPRIFNGVVLITKDEQVQYVKEYGYADFEQKTPISIDDHFRIMSNSKQITATLILIEVQKGNIELANSVKDYLSHFPASWADSVTVHQLLNMSSGIIALDKPLLFEPGNGYRYSNPGYGLLGRILEEVTGETFVENANALFRRLGMENTYCYELGQSRNELINSYWIKDGQLSKVAFDSMGFTQESWKDFVPAGGIISHAKDLVIWDHKLHKGEIIDSHHLQLMKASSNRGPHAAFDNDTIGYGYGLRIHDTHSTYHLGHGGRGFGFASIKFYIPDKDVDVIIWENVYSRDTNWLAGDMVYHFENEIRKIVLNSSLVD